MWRRYLALGDSFSEGLSDPYPDGSYRGWTDRTAEHLAKLQDDFQYANVAIRGRKMSRIIDEQIPIALDLKPDLVSIAAGVNDALRRNWEPIQVIKKYEHGIAQLRGAGIEVLMVAFGDPENRGQLAGVRERLQYLNHESVKLANKYDCHLVNFWPERGFDHDIFWSDDRLHLSSLGHKYAAQAALHALGLHDDSWRTPIEDFPPDPNWLNRRRSDLAWLANHMAPWAIRRIQGRSSGDGLSPKRPEFAPMHQVGEK
ncbi:MAG: SGNH/GDSL hydrolase family protein [Candidatus Nanopelagicales bacterium]